MNSLLAFELLLNCFILRITIKDVDFEVELFYRGMHLGERKIEVDNF